MKGLANKINEKLSKGVSGKAARYIVNVQNEETKG